MMTHILLIDDDEDEHLFFRWSVEKINIEFCLFDAYSTEQALSFFRHVVPDIIFLDINMPITDGFDCLARLRQIPIAKIIPIYMYSTEIDDTTIRRAMKMGASGCLKKSRSQEHLCNNIMDIMRAEPLLNFHHLLSK